MGGVVEVKWVWLFLDTVETEAGPSWEFWRQVTGSALSPTRGERSEFATFLPSQGDPWIRVQAVQSGGGVHLDLDVDNPRLAATAAAALGATELGTIELGTIDDETGSPGVVIMATPGGQTFCFTTHQGERRSQQRQAREGLETIVDQVCLDLPELSYAVDAVFWHELTGWELGHGSHREFSFLRRPEHLPVRVLLQRLDDREGLARAHVDLACRDRGAARARHEALGAHFVAEGRGWTVMSDPVGRHYCLTDRDPATGTRPAATERAEPSW